MVMMQLRLMLVMRRTVKMPVVRMLAVDLSQETREATRGDLPTPQPKNLSGRTLIIVSKPTEGDMMMIPSLPNKPKLTGGSSQLLNCATTFYYCFRSGAEDQSLKYIYHYSVVRSIAEKGPSAEEKISSLEAVVSNYEAKVSGLEHEMETQREMYETKLAEFTKR